MDQAQDFKSLQDQVQAALVASTRTSGQISSQDLAFQRSLNPEVGIALDEQSQRLLTLAGSLLKSAASISEIRAPVLQDADDVENNWRSVVDVIDSLLEKSDICLDEYTGVIKRREPTTKEQSVQTPSKARKQLGNAFRTQNLLKPQLSFEIKPDNNDTSPWKPFIATKPHATIPLEESLGTITNDFGQQQYRHPYETEILQLKYPNAVYEKADPIPFLPVESTSATFVDTEEGVMEMLNELKSSTEIAIDLEHHDARSYVGLVSLMQISTRQRDWIVDTLKPWRQRLQVLNEVFADPKIVKVFHGAYMDIVWLQRDLGLYVVGLFDTYHASRALGYAGGSLAFLLKKFIDFDADKKYQMADWRIRPLPDEMFFYARSDTHFLLYIYDHMRNELIDRTNSEIPHENLIEIVLQKSKETSLLRYERQVYNAESGRGPGGWYSLLVKTPALFSNEQFAVFGAVHEWRDKVARIDDDSPSFVMPQHVLFSIAKLMPMDMIALLGIAHPASHNLKSRAGELLDLIKAAKARGKNGPSMMDILRPDSLGTATKKSLPVVADNNTDPTKFKALVADGGDLRSNSSTFWGGAFGSSIWDPPTLTKTDYVELAVPLPALTSEVFAGPNGWVETSQTVKENLIPLDETPKESHTQDEAFVIRRGSKRKIDTTSDLEPDQGSETYDISFEHKTTRKGKRQAAKQAKKAAKEAAEQSIAMDGDGEVDAEEPFDYSKAESVLHGKRKEVGKIGAKREEAFDPYAKSADAPKGMRRVQTERAGKSHTFRS